MGARITFAVLAHRDAETVAWLAENLRATVPGCDVALFDSSRDGSLRVEDVERLPTSQPLTYMRVAPFHYLAMRSLAGRDFDALVTLDWDVAMLRAGFAEELGNHLERFAYLGVRFSPIRQFEGSDVHRALWFRWDRYWAPLFQSRQPYYAYNPAQVFRRDLVDRILRDDRLPMILSACDEARTPIMEEIVWPTRVSTYGVPMAALPGSHGLTSGQPGLDELELLAADPSVHLVHKIVTRAQRGAVDLLREKVPDPVAAAERLAVQPALHGSRKSQLRHEARRLWRFATLLVKGP
jgi:hypothetical protein